MVSKGDGPKVTAKQLQRQAREGEHTARALTSLYEIVESSTACADPREAAARVLEIFSKRLAMRKGAVGYVGSRSSPPSILASRGVTREKFLGAFRQARGKARDAYLFDGGHLLLRSKGPRAVKDKVAANGRPSRGEIDFFVVPVPGDCAGRPFVAVDRLFPEEVDPSEDVRLLEAGACLLSPLFAGRGGEKDAPQSGGQQAPLGKVLQQQIAAWIEPMDTSRRLVRSDLYNRLIGEVEKILIVAVLQKTNHVQTEAARFLGINRNTLSRKIEVYGLKRPGL